jgi:hypothetical protein
MTTVYLLRCLSKTVKDVLLSLNSKSEHIQAKRQEQTTEESQR